MTLGDMLPIDVGLIDVRAVGAFIVLQALLGVLMRLLVGKRRNTKGAMGGRAEKGSLVADLYAYNILAMCYFGFVIYYGATAWFDGTAHATGKTASDRIYGFSQSFMPVTMMTAAYEVYNTLAVILLPEYRNAAFIGHHATTLYLSLHARTTADVHFLHFYGLFFFGVSNISSVPLTMIEFANLWGSAALLEASQTLFALTFVLVRSLYWPLVSGQFWLDLLEVWNAGAVHSTLAMVTFLVANVGLTGLQLYWTTLILKAAAEKVKPPPKVKKAAARGRGSPPRRKSPPATRKNSPRRKRAVKGA